MLNKIKKIVKIFFPSLQKAVAVPTGKNFTVGQRTEIQGTVDNRRALDSILNIGNDCLINSSISLETNEAIVNIGDNVFIGGATRIVCTKSITIESDVLISGECLIQDSDNHSFDFETRKKDTADWKRGYHDWSKHPSKAIKISHGAWIGAKVIILKGVTIGEKAIVGAGSVVTRDVSPGTIVAGNPARFIKNVPESQPLP